MIRVLVVEDDFRVARVHAEFTEQVPDYRVIGIAHTGAEARALLAEHAVELVLLDDYLPDCSGADLLAELRADAIMLTAASDAASVRAALAAGALNYLVKPFTAEQLRDRLLAYARYHRHLGRGDRAVSQDEIDQAMRLLHEGDRPPLPKGHSSVTATLVADALRAADQPRSASSIAAELGISRATAQRYLAALAEDGQARMTLRYGTTGRPEHRYLWRG